MTESLSNLGSSKVDATEKTNVTDQMTAIVRWQPKDGLKLVVRNLNRAGIPLYALFRDGADNDLPLDTEIAFRWESPADDQPTIVSEKLSNIRPWRQLSLKDQQNEEYRRQVHIDLNGQGVETTDVEYFEIAIKSSAQIDWSNAQVEIDRKAVDVVSGE